MENPQPLRENVLLLDHSHFELSFSCTQLEYLWVQLLTFISHPVGDYLREKPCAIFPRILFGKVHMVIRSCCGQTHFLTQHMLQPLTASAELAVPKLDSVNPVCPHQCCTQSSCLLAIWRMQPWRCWNPMRNFFCPLGWPGRFLLGCFQASWFSASCSLLHIQDFARLCWPTGDSHWPALTGGLLCISWSPQLGKGSSWKLAEGALCTTPCMVTLSNKTCSSTDPSSTDPSKPPQPSSLGVQPVSSAHLTHISSVIRSWRKSTKSPLKKQAWMTSSAFPVLTKPKVSDTGSDTTELKCATLAFVQSPAVFKCHGLSNVTRCEHKIKLESSLNTPMSVMGSTGLVYAQFDRLDSLWGASPLCQTLLPATEAWEMGKGFFPTKTKMKEVSSFSLTFMASLITQSCSRPTYLLVFLLLPSHL